MVLKYLKILLKKLSSKELLFDDFLYLFSSYLDQLGAVLIKPSKIWSLENLSYK